MGETLRHIIGKTICLVSRDDVQSICDESQLCAGLKCGIESAIHAANDLLQDSDVGMLVMDASNAFNYINRLSLLLNARVLWPRASQYIINTYRGWSTLIIKGCSDKPGRDHSRCSPFYVHLCCSYYFPHMHAD